MDYVPTWIWQELAQWKYKYNPPFSSAQCKPEKSVKHWLVVKQRRTRSDIIPLITSRYQKSKSLVYHGGLASFFAMESLTKACTTQNCFYLCFSKSKSSTTWLIPAFLCEGPFFYFDVESVFLFILSPPSKHTVLTLGAVDHIISLWLNMILCIDFIYEIRRWKLNF